jgi:glutamine amidotransferase
MNETRNGSKKNVAIVDYGLGNLFSIKQACEHAGLNAVITAEIRQILDADAVILPGVGAFGDAMESLRKGDLVSPLLDMAASGKPLVGICLGLQLLMTESYEFGRHRGLGLIDGPVVRFETGGIAKVPEVGWNRIRRSANGNSWDRSLLKDIPDGDFMYFVHSFYAKPEDSRVTLSFSQYGTVEFCSSIRKGQIHAFQFHPERSGPSGLTLYRNMAAQLQTTAH